jgi:metallopeptidase YgjP-like protein
MWGCVVSAVRENGRADQTWLHMVVFSAGYGLSSGHASTERVGIEVKALHVRRMTHKCGSCSTAGRLTVNAELLFEAAEVRKKVIVHELLHLKVPNRGEVLRVLLWAYLSSDGTTAVSTPTR